MAKKEDMTPETVQETVQENAPETVQENAPENAQTPLMLTADQLTSLVANAVAAAAEKLGAIAATGKTTEREKIVKRIPAEQKMVKIKLFRDNGRYADDVYASLNGKHYNVPRGVEVEVPEGVAKIIENSQKQDEATDIMVRKLAQKWEEKEKKL